MNLGDIADQELSPQITMPPKHGHHGQHSSGTSYGGGGGSGSSGFVDDPSAIEHHANQHAGDSGDRSLFGNAISMLQNNAGSLQGQNVDEQSMVQSHQSFFSTLR